MDAVALRLFGRADLLVDGERARLDTRKAMALASYLEIEGAVARDSLCALLWPDSDDEHARAALRRTLSSLRSAAPGDVIVTDRRTAALAAEVTSDIAEFDRSIARTRTHGHSPDAVCDRCVPDLQAATDLYTGAFLDGFSLRATPEFENWTRVVAETYRARIARVLERLATATASLGDYHRAVEAARRWVGLDELHEPAHRHLMLMLAWAGDRVGAIDAYRACVAVLNDELGVTPLAETTELYEAILDDDLPPAPAQRRRVRSEASIVAPIAKPLVGRADALEALDSELDLTRRASRIAIIEGDPWMGKTRLLEEFATVASSGGHAVLLARGYPAERDLPYGALVQLLRAAVRQERLDISTLPEWAKSEVSRLLPEIGTPPDPMVGVGDTRLVDALATALRHIVPRGTLVIGVDDAHWMDGASLSALSYVCHRGDEPGVLLVLAAVKDADLGIDGMHILLDPLTVADLDEVAVDPAAAERAIDEAGGVPLLVSERLRGADPDEVAAGMRRYIDQLLRGLDDLTEQIAAAASVLSGRSDVRLLRGTSGRSEDEVIEAADELSRRGILRELPGTAGKLVFALHAMEQTVYESLSPLRRRLLHRRAATVLQQGPAAQRDPSVALAVADHLRLGGLEDEAATWYAEAADLAAALHAASEAESAYRSALAMQHPDPGPIHFALGDVLLAKSQFRDAAAAFQTAAALGTAALVARAEHRLGDIQRRLGRFDQAEQHFEIAEPEHPDLGSLYADWALLDLRCGRSRAAEARAREAVELAVAGGSPIAESRARDILGIVVDDPSQLERAVELAGDDPPARMASLNSLAHAVAGRGDAEAAVALVAEALLIAESLGDRHRRAALLNHLADLHHRAGREEESRSALTEAVRLFADVQPDAWEPEVWLLARW